jgi:hypothetical protein
MTQYFFVTNEKPVARRGKVICPIGADKTMVAWLGLATGCGDGEMYREIIANDLMLDWATFDNYWSMQHWLQMHPPAESATLSSVMPQILAQANPKHEA